MTYDLLNSELVHVIFLSQSDKSLSRIVRVTSVDDISSRKGRINYYISPLKLYQETGYIWKGIRDGN